MGDRTYFQFYVYDCPERQRADLVEAVEDVLGEAVAATEFGLWHAEKAADPLASLNLTPAEVRENIKRAVGRLDPAVAVAAEEAQAASDAEAMLQGVDASPDAPDPAALIEQWKTAPTGVPIPPGFVVRQARLITHCDHCGAEIEPPQRYVEYVRAATGFRSGTRHCLACASEHQSGRTALDEVASEDARREAEASENDTTGEEG
jgi:hypothetical protein